MIEIKNLTKNFEKTKALNNISFSVSSGSVFGLVGSNGAGKSTLLRIMAGVFQPDDGNIYMDGETPFENNHLKGRTAYVSDYPYFFPGATVESMAKYVKSIYPTWSDEEYNYLKSIFPIDTKKKISTMSKGMQRQGAIMLALAYKPDYILFDEIFDGLDPVIRELVKNPDNISIIKEKLNIVKETHQGKMVQITVKGAEEEIAAVVESANPVFTEMLPLTLEELFISEMEVAGYDINKFFQ